MVHLPKSRTFLTLHYTCPITLLPLLSPLMPLSAILVLLSILISLSSTTSSTSPAPASCTFATSAASDPMLDFKTASTIATFIVHSKLDYCNSLNLDLDSTQIQRLQLTQNSLAQAVTRTPRHHHITPVLETLHWLKIPERIHFKVLSLT